MTKEFSKEKLQYIQKAYTSCQTQAQKDCCISWFTDLVRRNYVRSNVVTGFMVSSYFFDKRARHLKK